MLARLAFHPFSLLALVAVALAFVWPADDSWVWASVDAMKVPRSVVVIIVAVVAFAAYKMLTGEKSEGAGGSSDSSSDSSGDVS